MFKVNNKDTKTTPVRVTHTMRENADQTNSEYGHFLRSDMFILSVGDLKTFKTFSVLEIKVQRR